MFGFGSHTARTAYAALFDIGSESVGVAIIASNRKNDFPQTIFSHRVDIRVAKNDVGYTEHLRRMKEALFSASLVLSRDGLAALRTFDTHARIGFVSITVGAPWSRTISRNVHYESDTEVKVTRAIIDDLISSAEHEIHEGAVTEAGNKAQGAMRIVERSTIDVRLNEYPVHDPSGLRAKTISLVHVTGLIPEDVRTAMHDIEEKVFPHTTEKLHTFLLVLYCVIRDVLEQSEELTIVNVSGENTEIGIVSGGTLIQTVSLPHGINDIIRGLMDHEHLSGSEVRSQILMYERNELDTPATERIQKELTDYRERFTASLEEKARLVRFPKRVIFSAPSFGGELLRELLTDPIQKTLLTNEPIVTLDSILKRDAVYHDGDDMYLTMLARFFHKLRGCGEIGEA